MIVCAQFKRYPCRLGYGAEHSARFSGSHWPRVGARRAPSLCSLGPEVAIFRKTGRAIALWRRYARVGDYGPFLRSRCEPLCSANAPSALTMRSERPRNGRTFQLSNSQTALFLRKAQAAGAVVECPGRDQHPFRFSLPFARTSPCDHQSVAPSILALYRGSITVRDRSRVSFAQRAPIACLPLQRVATRGCACRSAHPECRHISALSATLRLQPYDERSKHRLRFNGGQA